MEKNTVIKVENLSKQYRLGEVGTGTISHDLNRWWHRVRGKEDPYLRIGETNDRSSKGNSEYVWALQDINFEVQQGEILGIIGKNGAGKSTLLKILSKVTAPTTGSIKAKGRIASLLEVGTGFHPELTGRENIYLNGTILGMTKREVTVKLDEIVMFHIHCGRPGQLGPIIVDFDLAGDLKEYMADGFLALEITNEDIVAVTDNGQGLVGAFTAGCPIVPTMPLDKVKTIAGMALIAQQGELYFNLHTAGQTFFGDIRGQLYPAAR